MHRVIPGSYTEKRFGTRTTVFGERPTLDSKSEGRQERVERLARETKGSGEASTEGEKKDVVAANA